MQKLTTDEQIFIFNNVGHALYQIAQLKGEQDKANYLTLDLDSFSAKPIEPEFDCSFYGAIEGEDLSYDREYRSSGIEDAELVHALDGHLDAVLLSIQEEKIAKAARDREVEKASKERYAKAEIVREKKLLEKLKAKYAT